MAKFLVEQRDADEEGKKRLPVRRKFNPWRPSGTFGLGWIGRRAGRTSGQNFGVSGQTIWYNCGFRFEGLLSTFGWFQRTPARDDRQGADRPLQAREEQALRPSNGRLPFRQLRELSRRVQNDACVDIDTNHYSVPRKLIGVEVTVMVGGRRVRIHHAGAEVACHDKRLGRRERAADRAHLCVAGQF